MYFYVTRVLKRVIMKARLLFTDTDSLAYEIETEDIYADMKEEKTPTVLRLLKATYSERLQYISTGCTMTPSA